MSLGGIGDGIIGRKIRGTVVLIKKSVLDFNDLGVSLDNVNGFLDLGVSFQLVSAIYAESGNAQKGKVGKKAYLEYWITTLPSLKAGESAYGVTFDYEEAIGLPGAVIVSNNHSVEFFLKNITLEDFPGEGIIRFDCNSWLYPQYNYGYDRIFFTNKTYLVQEMPVPLLYYREQELMNLRGNGQGERKVYDRVYDYAVYNDLGDPDKGELFVRPILGGSPDLPYPRRGRTGRPPTRTDPNTESRLPLIINLSVYVPRDERFGHAKMSDFLAFELKSLAHAIIPALESFLDGTESWDSFQEIDNLYKQGFKVPVAVLDFIRRNVPFEILEEIFRTDGEQFLTYPLPDVIKEDKLAWRTDEEFGREMLAGANPVIIRHLEKFPPTSNLDPSLYGDQSSKITGGDIEKNLAGKSVSEALSGNKLFILDHHDSFMPYLTRINSTSSKAYASRTLLFLQDDDTLKPVAIELSLPNPNGDQYGAISQVYTPAEEGVEAAIWQLAKAYVVVNDSCAHHLISHWLSTHAVIEPFVIAANRQLSAVHPVYKLLQPHFRDTMNINANGRQTLVNAEGILELTVFPGKYAMEMSAEIYKVWVFPDQALPADLLKRGVAVEDSSAPNGVRLLIKDYPYAVDGLEIWSAIKSWVVEYLAFYYTSDLAVQNDAELQAWWKELRDVGHGDKKDASWWPTMQTRTDLVESCTTFIWITSALHAAVNFGQYPYTGYHPNRPTVSRRFMPEVGTPEYVELQTDPETVFLNTITAELQTLISMSLMEILSRHASDEVYLGQRDSEHWTADAGPLKAFEQFGKNLAMIEGNISNRNNDATLKNRAGPVKIPYTLLFPTSAEGLTGKGIPNSISI